MTRPNTILFAISDSDLLPLVTLPLGQGHPKSNRLVPGLCLLKMYRRCTVYFKTIPLPTCSRALPGLISPCASCWLFDY